jgi:hypothetical protein
VDKRLIPSLSECIDGRASESLLPRSVDSAQLKRIVTYAGFFGLELVVGAIKSDKFLQKGMADRGKLQLRGIATSAKM